MSQIRRETGDRLWQYVAPPGTVWNSYWNSDFFSWVCRLTNIFWLSLSWSDWTDETSFWRDPELDFRRWLCSGIFIERTKIYLYMIVDVSWQFTPETLTQEMFLGVMVSKDVEIVQSKCYNPSSEQTSALKYNFRFVNKLIRNMSRGPELLQDRVPSWIVNVGSSNCSQPIVFRIIIRNTSSTLLYSVVLVISWAIIRLQIDERTCHMLKMPGSQQQAAGTPIVIVVCDLQNLNTVLQTWDVNYRPHSMPRVTPGFIKKKRGLANQDQSNHQTGHQSPK